MVLGNATLRVYMLYILYRFKERFHILSKSSFPVLLERYSIKLHRANDILGVVHFRR